MDYKFHLEVDTSIMEFFFDEGVFIRFDDLGVIPRYDPVGVEYDSTRYPEVEFEFDCRSSNLEGVIFPSDSVGVECSYSLVSRLRG